MQPLDIFVWIVMIVLVVAIVVIAIKLGALPGKIATKRKHPQAEAIHVCGWLGLLTLGVAWPIALVWAYTKPLHVLSGGDAESNTRIAQLSERIEALEDQLRELKQSKGGRSS